MERTLQTDRIANSGRLTMQRQWSLSTVDNSNVKIRPLD